MYLLCENNPKFEESGLLIKAAHELGISVSSWADDQSIGNYFVYGARPFVLPYVDSIDHVYSRQEYLYNYSFLDSIGLNAHLFNQNCSITTAANIYRVIYGDSSYFIRPNSGEKSFNGQVINTRTLKADICSILQIDPWEIVVIAKAQKPPKEEYRFFCFKDDDKISVLGCRYLPEASLEVDRQITFYAENMAARLFDKIPFGNSFVLDIALDEYGYKTIIELNSVNSSSFYCIDPEELLKLIWRL